MKQLVGNLEQSAEPNSLVFFGAQNKPEIKKLSGLIKSDNQNALSEENGTLKVLKSELVNTKLVKGVLPNIGLPNTLYAETSTKKLFVYFLNQWIDLSYKYQDSIVDFYSRKSDVVVSDYDGFFKTIVVVFDESNSDNTIQYIVKNGELVEFGVGGSSINMVINSFTNSSPNNLKGSTVNVTLNWNLNQTPKLLKVDNVDVTPLTATSIVKSSINANTNFTLTANNSTGSTGSVSATTSVNFYNNFYVGASTTATVDQSTVGALITSLNANLMTNKTRTSTINANGKYIWFAAPASFGVPTVKINGFIVSGFTVQDLNVTNSAGFQESYKIYSTDLMYGTSIPLEVVYP